MKTRLLCLMLLAVLVSGQRVSITPVPKRTAQDSVSPDIRISVQQVQIPVFVTRKDTGETVRGLGRDDFRVTQDKKELDVLSVIQQDAPIAVNLLLDTSSSMKPTNDPNKIDLELSEDKRDRLTPAKQAIIHLLERSVANDLADVLKGDVFSFTTFADKPVAVGGFGYKAEDIKNDLAIIEAGGRTALFDSLKFVSERMRSYLLRGGQLPPNRVLFVLSDGEDNESGFWPHEGQVVREMREADMTVYSVGIFHKPEFLAKLSEATGGKTVFVNDLTKLKQVVYDLAIDMHNQYLLTFALPEADGKNHKVKVVPKNPAYKVTCRCEYLADPAAR